MTGFWTDAHLSAGFAEWLGRTYCVDVQSVHMLGMDAASDRLIFQKARAADVVFITKDRDFVDLIEQHGPPPRVIRLTCGNTSEFRLRQIFEEHFHAIQQMLDRGETLIEVGG